MVWFVAAVVLVCAFINSTVLSMCQLNTVQELALIFCAFGTTSYMLDIPYLFANAWNTLSALLERFVLS